MKVVGFFAGVGGIELGFKEAGFDVIWSNEIDKYASETYRLNHESKLVEKSIVDVSVDEVPDCDVIVGGFPCQAFSIAGYRKGFEDERGELFFQIARIIKGKKPRFIFLENVKNLVNHDNGNTLKVIKETLEDIGYKLKIHVFNSIHYGNTPQNRERTYIVGFLNEEDYVNYKTIEPVELTKIINDIVKKDEKVDDRFYYTKDKCSFYNILEESMINDDTIYQWRRTYVRENKSKVCPTLTANMGTGGHNVPLVKTDFGIRKLTPKECFMFQGYPEDFKLPENMAISHLYKQAGNSVVVPVIKRIAEEIIKLK